MVFTVVQVAASLRQILECEDVERSPLSAANGNVETLGVAPVQVESQCLKTGDKLLANLIATYAEVRAALENTRRPLMLD
jgi:hypothetical protein